MVNDPGSGVTNRAALFAVATELPGLSVQLKQKPTMYPPMSWPKPAGMVNRAGRHGSRVTKNGLQSCAPDP